MHKIFYLLALCGFSLLTLGCSESGNTVVEPGDDSGHEEAMNEMQSQFEGSGGDGGGTKKPGN